MAGYPVTLPAGALLADLETVEVVGNSTEPTVWEDVEIEITEMLDRSVLPRCRTESMP